MNEQIFEGRMLAQSRAFAIVVSASIFMVIGMIAMLFQLAG